MPKTLAEAAEDLPTKEARRIRELERQLAASRQLATSYKNHWNQSEKELAEAQSVIETFQATAGEFNHEIPYQKKGKLGNATALIVATDWHAEQQVEARTVNSLNHFDLDIATRRIDQLWRKAVYLTESSRSLAEIRTCTVAVLGDLITGTIHDELLETNFLSPSKATLFVQERLEAGLRYLLEHGGFEQIDVLCCDGNHGRTTAKKRIATRTSNSFEWMAYHNVAKRFEGEKRLRFVIADGYHLYHEIQGWTCRFHHGDAIQYWGGVGGLGIPAAKAIAQWNKSKPASYDFFGHWHQFGWHRNFVSCPCLIGFDAFALHIKAEFEPPAQAFGVIDRERGLTEMRRIFVEAHDFPKAQK